MKDPRNISIVLLILMLVSLLFLNAKISHTRDAAIETTRDCTDLVNRQRAYILEIQEKLEPIEVLEWSSLEAETLEEPSP